MRHNLGGRHRRVAQAALAFAVAATVLLAPPFSSISVVLGHCPGGTTPDWVTGRQNTSAPQDGVRAYIELTEGALCSSGVSHSVTLCTNTGCGTPQRKVQAGWAYYTFYTNPKGYCEFDGNNYYRLDYAISQSSHEYRMVYDTTDDAWFCYIDASAKSGYGVELMGFEYGYYVNSQGETHAPHNQIGEMAPGKLRWYNHKRRVRSSGSWVTTNHFALAVNNPYDSELGPVSGEFRAWTNAH